MDHRGLNHEVFIENLTFMLLLNLLNKFWKKAQMLSYKHFI